jgi:hypothetical protein
MSADRSPRQISAADAMRSVMISSPKLAAVAAVCMLPFLMLPAAYVSGSFMGISSGGLSFSGSQIGGWTAWLAFVAFVASATTRFVPSIALYRRLADFVAFGMTVAVLIYAAFASPIADAVHQVHQVQAQFGGLVGGDLGRNLGASFGRNMPPPPVSFLVLPQIGILPFVLAPLLLAMAKRRERVAVA